MKSNMGHAQAAAGIAGVIKMVQAMHHDTLPATLHASEPSSHVDWDAGHVQLLTEAQPWPADHTRRAAISAFGISGTNAHVILEDPPPLSSPAPSDDSAKPDVGLPVVPWVLSAKSARALSGQARKLLEHPAVKSLDASGSSRSQIADVGWSLVSGRSVFDHRAVVLAGAAEGLVEGLQSLVSGAEHPGVVTGSGAGPLGGRVLVFGGQGSQWLGMGRELLESSPVFAASISECEEAFGDLVDWFLTETLRGSGPRAGDVNRVDVVQPVLFAVMVSLARLWKWMGVEPDAVVGHSQGEIAAACVAGALSLQDAARVVVLRSQVLAGVAGQGGMAAVSASVDQVTDWLTRWDGRLEVAAVNGPSSVVVSGDADPVAEFVDWCEGEGVRARRLAVDYASHCSQMEPLREPILQALQGIRPRSVSTAFYSTVTGGRIDTAELDGSYWFENLRQRVRFEDASRALLADGFRVFVEATPHPSLMSSVHDTAESFDDGPVVAVGSLRRDRGGLDQFLTSVAQAFVAGVEVDWKQIFEGTCAAWTDLPTYAFDHRHYWLNGRSGHDVSGVGQSAVEHPLLGAAVELPDGGGVVLTGRLSIGENAWLADHAVLGQVLFPGTGFVEAAIRAGDQVGAGHLSELTLHNPLLLTKEHATRLHVMLTPLSDGSQGSDPTPGDWRVVIYSRPDGQEDQPWSLHAEGVLSSGLGRGEAGAEIEVGGWGAGGAWPPPSAEAVDITDVYDRLAERGYEYGPAFQGLKGVWRRGSEVFVETVLPETVRAEAPRFGMHPALLDSVLHAGLVTDVLGVAAGGRVALPFCWNQVALHASGAATVRARLAPEGPDGLSVTVVDPSGQPVLTAESLLTRQVDPARLKQATSRTDSLYRLTWSDIDSLPTSAASTDDGESREDVLVVPVDQDGPSIELPDQVPSTVVLCCRTAAGSDDPQDVPGHLDGLVSGVLSAVQRWLARSDEDARLIVVTSGAVGREQDEVRDLAGAAVWGLVRSAQSENPGRISLVDVPDWDTPIPAVLAAASLDEPQCALRDGHVWAPRLRRLTGPAHEAKGGASVSTGSLIITGGTGGLGVLVARHAVERWGVRDVVLVSRRGPEAEGIEDVLAELRNLGAQACAVTCDVSDRAAVHDLIAGIRASGGRVAGIVHAAGVLDDGVVTGLTPERVRRVLEAKAQAAWNLHMETLEDEPGLFVMFSSIAGVLGSAGQASYAAANTFLDALAWHRRTQGLPAASLAWGLWASASGMTSHLDTTDQARLQRGGLLPLTTDQSLELLDAALASDHPAPVPARFDAASMQSAVTLPPMLAGLAPTRRAVASQAEGAGGDSLRARLAGLDADRRMPVVLDLVRSHAAAVLGHAGGAEIDPGQAFQDLGFDSLGAVEFRNRLSAAAGVRLPSTMTFDYPTPELLARFLLSEVVDDAPVASATSVVAGRAAMDDEPVAIVGMSCRFPGGVVSPEGLWDLVAEGRDVISEFPDDRGWDVAGIFDPEPGVPGKSYTRWGGFVEGATEFDAGFFGISPREAMGMDPQQRLLLEAVWEAFERAGIDPAGLRGSSTGVFAGMISQGYMGGAELEGFRLTGTTASVASGRVSYVLGLEGPAVTVDTACSSSLVALHLACQSVRSGESELAVAGGVTVMASSEMFVEFSRQRGLAPDGRCKSFGENADGTAWAEGVGVVVVERLSEARRLGHRVLAVVRGSAVNQDGASNGLTAPNGPSQQRVIRQALASAGLGVEDVDVVEAHGTGTTLGDPIEAQALLATYGQRPQDGPPLWLGSLKSNMGHAQAAAGVAGVIKMVQALHHDTLPATLHADEPSSHVDWDAGHVQLLTDAQPWPADHVRRAAVSSFGISGTNAHVIIEEPPGSAAVAQEETPGAKPPVIPWVLSAKSSRALSGQARKLLDYAAGRGLDVADDVAALADVGWSLVSGRSVFDHRAVVLGEDGQELLAGLRSVAEKPADELAGPAVSGVVRAGGTVAVFPGQGSQWLGMGRGLYEAYEVFAEAFDQVIAELESCLGDAVAVPLQEVLWGEDADLLNQTLFTQAGLFAVEVALFRLVEAWGLRPDFVLGHSVGEIAAAHVAGVLSLADAARLVAARGRLMQALPAGGAMAAVQTDEEHLQEFLTSQGLTDVGIAAVNAPGSIVVSGAANQVEQVVEWCKGQGRKATRLQVSHAFHSPLMDPMLAQFREVAESVTPRPAEIALVSNLTGTVADEEYGTPDYWVRHVRQPVRFADSIAFLHTQGASRFLELGPGTALTSLITQNPPALSASGSPQPDPLVVPTLRKGQDEPRTLLTGLAQAFVAGVDLDWKQVFDGTGATWTDLPTYAFDHRRYWAHNPNDLDVSGAGLSAVAHPLLAAAVELPGDGDGGGVVLTGRLSMGIDTWLADHAVQDQVIFPGTGFVEAAIRAGDQVGASHLRELILHTPLSLTRDHATRLHVRVTPLPDEAGDSGEWRVEIHSRPDTDEEQGWVLHAEGTLAATATTPDTATATAATAALAREAGEGAWPPPDAERLDTADLYERLAERGYEYGPAFQGLTAVWRRGEELFVEAALPEPAHGDASRFGLHPALLDAVLHGALVADVLQASGSGRVALPYCWNDVTLHATGAGVVRARLAPEGEDALSVSVVDPAGQPVLTAGSLLTRQVDPARLRRVPSATGWLHHLTWSPAETAGEGANARPEDVTVLTLAEAGGDHPAGTTLLYCDGAAQGDPDAAQSDVPDVVDGLVCRVLDALQWWLAAAEDQDHLVILTRNAVPSEDGAAGDLAAAAVWGLVRSAQAENPGRITLIDLDDQDTPTQVVLKAVALGEPQCVVRVGQVRVPRLRSLASAVPASTGQRQRPPAPDGALLISGGTGGLGALVARHAVREWGVRELVLVSRRGPEADGADDLVAELAGAGARVRLAACDVGDRDALRALVGAVHADGGRIGGVVHAAGVLGDGVLTGLSADRVRSVLAAKARAAWNLHLETAPDEPDLFVMFSSIAGVVGSPGQAAYAAANAFLDALAHHRRAQGMPAASLAWGLWAAPSGMTAGLNGADQARMRRGGLVPLAEAEGLALLDASLATGHPNPVPARLDVEAIAVAGAPVPPMLAPLLPVRRTAVVAAVVAATATAAATAAEPGVTRRDLRHRLVGLAPDARRKVLLDLVLGHAAAVLGHADPGEIDPGRPFLELGFDSLGTVTFRNALNQATGLGLTSMSVLDHNTPADLAAHIDAELDRGGQEAGRTGDKAADHLGDLFHGAVSAGEVHRAWGLLSLAATLRPTFEDPADAPPPVRLAEGDAPVQLVCIAAPTAMSGPGLYARMARSLSDRRQVAAVPLAGFRPGERLPASAEHAVGSLADGVLRAVDERPFVLIGHSSGGVLARAVARRLETSGARRPAGLIMLDSFRAEPDDWGVPLDQLITGILEFEDLLGRFDGERLTAMVSWCSLLPEIARESPAAPTLFVRCADPYFFTPAAESAGGEPEPCFAEPWEPAQELRHIDADHFGMMAEKADRTAGLVHAWIEELTAAWELRNADDRGHR
ncbi:malonyl CoA-acyl carrier protein transacylase [Actinomadura rupiterrae]|nr:malonyl CoA-acyl carrier protein transacylase [Actinomadura rupiterrae]